MESKRIIDINGKMISKMSIKDLYSEFVEFSSTFIGKALITGIALFIAYQFYQLGYAFLYGYYFGGSENNIVPLTIMINQIPFDIKYVTALGFLIFAVILLILILSYKYIETKKDIKQKAIILIFTVIIYALICSLLSLTIDNIHMNDSNHEIYKSVFYLFFAIYTTLNCINFFNYNYVNNILKSLILLFANTIFVAFNYVLVSDLINDNIFIWIFIILGSYAINSLLMYTINKIFNIFISILIKLKSFYIKYIWQTNVFLFITSFFIIKLFKINKWFIVISGIFLFLICFITWTVMKVKKIQTTKNNYKENKTCKTYQKSAKGEKTILISAFSVIIIIFLIVYVFMYSIFYNLGNYMGKVSNKFVYAKINIFNQNFDCSGIVIKQKNNTYYISDKNRNLIIITSNQVMITMPNNNEIQSALE
nr:hypothetical protein [uncultured Clostridium sp.]